MKKILILIMCIACDVFAQPSPGATPVPTVSTLTDAQTLAANVASNNIRDIVLTLYTYARKSDPNAAMDTETIVGMINRNVFLKQLLQNKIGAIKDYINQNTAQLNTARTQIDNTPSVEGSGIDAIFPARRVVDGLGSFLAERFKDELTQRYLQAFRDSIVSNNDRFHYEILLPKTYASLVHYENIFDYKSFMTALKEAFKDDLDNLPSNSLLFVDKMHDKGAFTMDAAAYYLGYYLADFAVNEIPNGADALQLFANFRDYKYKEKVPQDLSAKLEVVSAFATNLTSNPVRPHSSADIRKVLNNLDQLLAFCGLTLEKERRSLEAARLSSSNAYVWINSQTVSDVTTVLKRLSNLKSKTERFANSDKQFDDYVTLISGVSPEVQDILDTLEVVDADKLKLIMGTVDHVVNIATYAEEQKYGLIITESLELFTHLKLEKTAFYRNFSKYGLFISNVAQAQTSDQVKEALEIAALPVGSYKIKRNTLADISFQAYPGVFAGAEFASGVPSSINNLVNKESVVFGFTAPVGLAFSWGGRKTKAQTDRTTYNSEYEVTKKQDGRTIKSVKYVSGRSHSVFISIIDIGAVTSFRLTDDETETLPEFTWENILAPGVSYVLGLKNTPLSWGVGVQYGPQLRAIDDTDITLSGSLVTTRTFLVVDIPIFSFYSRTTRK
jgi:hypothetical protein